MSQPDLFDSDSRDKLGEPATGRDAQDERYYDAFVRDQDPLDVQAATWVARRRNGLDAQSEAERRNWLAADPAHQAAFDDMEETFGRLRDMSDEEIESLKVGLRPGEVSTSPPAYVSAPANAIPSTKPIKPSREGQRTPPRVPPRVPVPGRRTWLVGIVCLVPQAATAAVALGAVGGGWVGWEHWRRLPTFEHSYTTARGQQLNIDLPDGSHLLLDTATQAEVSLYRDRREVRLRETTRRPTASSAATVGVASPSPIPGCEPNCKGSRKRKASTCQLEP